MGLTPSPTRLAAGLLVGSAALIVLGVGLIYPPAALIVAGLIGGAVAVEELRP